MSQRIRLGISTCPNDTFAFHALMNRLVDWRGLEFQVELLDIQELNERLFRGEFEVAKASFHAAPEVGGPYARASQRIGFGIWCRTAPAGRFARYANPILIRK